VPVLKPDKFNRLAEEKWYSRFTKNTKENYNEMGLLSISVVAYTRKDGQFAINMYVSVIFIVIIYNENIVRHDNIGDMLGVRGRSFQEMYEDKTNDLMRSVNEYIKTLRASAGAGAGATGSINDLTIKIDVEGFPIVPRPPSWDILLKRDLEKIYRGYLSTHYSKLICPKSAL
jgi:hypothetical protein